MKYCDFSEEQKEKMRVNQRKWRKNNKEKVSIRNKSYYYANLEDQRQRVKNNWRKNKKLYSSLTEEEKVIKRKYSREWKENNRERHREKRKQYYILNREKINNYEKNKKNNDPFYKLKGTLRVRTNSLLKSKGVSKSVTALKLVGCTVQELKEHLESQFTVGMSWDNHGRGKGKWNIDHIIPCDSFNLLDEEEQRKCFHYSNLQPLWFEDNLYKANKILTNEELVKLNPKLRR